MFFLLEIIAHRELSNDLTQFGLVLFVLFLIQCYSERLLFYFTGSPKKWQGVFCTTCNLTFFLEDDLKSAVLSKVGVSRPKNA